MMRIAVALCVFASVMSGCAHAQPDVSYCAQVLAYERYLETSLDIVSTALYDADNRNAADVAVDRLRGIRKEISRMRPNPEDESGLLHADTIHAVDSAITVAVWVQSDGSLAGADPNFKRISDRFVRDLNRLETAYSDALADCTPANAR